MTTFWDYDCLFFFLPFIFGHFRRRKPEAGQARRQISAKVPSTASRNGPAVHGPSEQIPGYAARVGTMIGIMPSTDSMEYNKPGRKSVRYLFEAHTWTMVGARASPGACTRHVPGRRRTSCRMTSISRCATEAFPLACGHSSRNRCAPFLLEDKRVDFCQSNPDFWWPAPLPQQKFPVQLLVCPMASPAACGQDAVLPRFALPPCPARLCFATCCFHPHSANKHKVGFRGHNRGAAT